MDQMPEELLYAQLAIKFLQAAAQQLHTPNPATSSTSTSSTPPQPPASPQQPAGTAGRPRGTSINFVLSSLMLVRRLARTALLAHPTAAAKADTLHSGAKDAAAAEPLTQLQERVGTVLDKLRSGGHLPAGSKLPQVDDIHKYKTSLQDAVHKEVADLEAFWQQNSLDTREGARANLGRLTRAVRHLHSVERGHGHQARVAAEVDSLCASSSYSDDNFAYGTTPYATWYKVMSQEPVVAQLSRSSSTYMVWGSSLGWLLFYAAATFPVTCIGYELLTSLAKVSQQVAKDTGFEGVQVFAQDLMSSSLKDVSVLLLTNQCWDEELVEASARKIADELPTGAVCIEYTGVLEQVLGAAYSCIVSPVSWNPGQKLYTYIKQ